MSPRSNVRAGAHCAGMALPVVLIILAVMLLGSVYLLRTVNSTSLTTGNLANDATLSRAADLGLHTAFAWLQQTAKTNKAALLQDDTANGYHAHWDVKTPRDAGFWDNQVTMTGEGGTTIAYVIYRLCNVSGSYNSGTNACMQTAAPSGGSGTGPGLGSSFGTGDPLYDATPQLHYLITARIVGGRGSNVTNQMIVLIGA